MTKMINNSESLKLNNKNPRLPDGQGTKNKEYRNTGFISTYACLPALLRTLTLTACAKIIAVAQALA